MVEKTEILEINTSRAQYPEWIVVDMAALYQIQKSPAVKNWLWTRHRDITTAQRGWDIPRIKAKYLHLEDKGKPMSSLSTERRDRAIAAFNKPTIVIKQAKKPWWVRLKEWLKK